MDTLDYIEGENERATLIEMVRDLAEALVKVQSKEKHVWNQVPDKENEYGNYLEISEPKQINNLLGIGAFLMASVEMELAQQKMYS